MDFIIMWYCIFFISMNLFFHEKKHVTLNHWKKWGEVATSEKRYRNIGRTTCGCSVIG